MTKTEKTEAVTAADTALTEDELKTLAEDLSDEGRKLLARLGERYESGLSLPDDQEPFDELVDNELASGIHGTLVRLTPKGRQLTEYLGAYRPGVDLTKEPKLQPPADELEAEEKQARIREATEAEAKAREKAEKAAEKETEKAK